MNVFTGKYIIVLLFLGEHIAADTDKRLLINDPDVLTRRIASMETTMASLATVVTVMNTTLQQVLAENKQQEQTIQQLSQQLQTSKTGSTYIRWGRNQCPDNQTEIVYSGYTGGGHYNEKGSAAEYVCLPPDPDFGKTSGSDAGRMYGGEFDNNFFASDSNDEDVPCALCRAPHATSVIMIPGKNSCYSGWKLEYHGYLASGHHTHEAASAYVCVDIKPEYIVGGLQQNLGKLFYDVIAKCGTLKCPPYKANYPLTCVVCSK